MKKYLLLALAASGISTAAWAETENWTADDGSVYEVLSKETVTSVVDTTEVLLHPSRQRATLQIEATYQIETTSTINRQLKLVEVGDNPRASFKTTDNAGVRVKTPIEENTYNLNAAEFERLLESVRKNKPGVVIKMEDLDEFLVKNSVAPEDVTFYDCYSNSRKTLPMDKEDVEAGDYYLFPEVDTDEEGIRFADIYILGKVTISGFDYNWYNNTYYDTVEEAAENLSAITTEEYGYSVSGLVMGHQAENIIANHGSALYHDFSNATILGDVDVQTADNNALYYFQSDAKVSGEKNIVKGRYCDNLVIKDRTSFYNKTSFTAESAVYNRTFAAGKWTSLTLPFTYENSNFKFATLKDFDGETLSYEYGIAASANRPYLAKNNGTEDVTKFEVKDATVPATADGSYDVNGASFKSVLTESVSFAADAMNIYSYNTKGNIAHVNGKTLVPFLSYFEIAVGSAAPTARFYDMNGVESIQDMETGLAEVAEVEVANAIYTLEGVKVSAESLKPGIYVVNGKKVVIK